MGDEELFLPIATDRFHRAPGQRFFTKIAFFVGFWLLVEIGMPTVIVAFEIRRSGFAAKVAVDALIINVVSAGDVLGVFVCCVSHVKCLEGLGRR